MKRFIRRRIALPLTLAVAAGMLAACSGDGGSAVGQLVRENAGEAAPTAQAIATATPWPTFEPAPTETPNFADAQPAMQPQLEQPAQVIPTEAPAMQPATPEPATATPAPAPTATADIAGFVMSGIDESAQPCPAPFWKRGRCTATAAQIEQYAQEAQP